MRLYYATDSAEREARGDDSYRGEVWPCDPDPVAEVDSVEEALRVADEHGTGIYYLRDEEGAGGVVGSICSLHAARFEDRVRFYAIA